MECEKERHVPLLPHLHKKEFAALGFLSLSFSVMSPDLASALQPRATTPYEMAESQD